MGECPVCFSASGVVESCYHRVWDCWTKPEKERTFFRRDGFTQHVKSVHGSEAAVILHWRENKGKEVPVSLAARTCSFCLFASTTWTERVEHVAEHFRRRERLHGIW